MKIYLALLAIIGLGGVYTAILRASNKALKSKLHDEEELSGRLTLELERSKHIVKALEGAIQNENAKKKKIHTGSNADKFAASLDILSNKTAGKAD